MAIGIGRRQFISALGGALVAWPLAAIAQQTSMPVIGFLAARSESDSTHLVSAFHRGLKEAGFTVGQNVVMEYCWAEGHYDRLATLAADLVRRKVAVIAATGTPPALVAKAATTTIPIDFVVAGDPVQLGLVASLNRPDGNVTGVTVLGVEVGSKRLELLHELVTTATVIAALINPTSPTAETMSRDLQVAARTFGLQLQILQASTEHDIDSAFATLVKMQAGALVIGADPFFTSQSEQLATLAMRHGVPAVYEGREFAAAGGLMSYGSDIADSYRLAGNYAGRILKGDKPADLPVQEATKVELYINLKTAKALGITFPLTLLGRADEVIE